MSPSPHRSGRSWLRALTRGRGRDLLVLASVVVVLVGLRVVVDRDDDGSSTADGPRRDPSASPSLTPSPLPSSTPAPTTPAAPESPDLGLDDLTCVREDVTHRLRVVTYNIKSARFGGRSRLAQIADELRSVRPDVVLLQEVDNYPGTAGGLGDQPAVLGRALDYSWSFGLNVRFSASRLYGTAILSRFPLEDQSNTLLPNRPGMQQRGLLGATITVEGVKIRVYNTHLQHTSRSMREDQVRAILDRLDDDPLPKVLGGDLNDTPASPVLRTAYTALADTWAQVGSGLGPTVPANAPRARIDYLLFQQGDRAGTTITPLSAEVLGVGSSDHRAILATYRIQAKGKKVCVPTG